MQIWMNIDPSHTVCQTWSSRDLSLGLETSRDPVFKVLVFLGLEALSLGLGLGLELLSLEYNPAVCCSNVVHGLSFCQYKVCLGSHSQVFCWQRASNDSGVVKNNFGILEIRWNLSICSLYCLSTHAADNVLEGCMVALSPMDPCEITQSEQVSGLCRFRNDSRHLHDRLLPAEQLWSDASPLDGSRVHTGLDIHYTFRHLVL